ncbi:RCC1 and BTB domain-containing protein 1-like [Cloeon dipterum]|uniref:RCC1 and BTB domain-containing protein 1-like n=1 Tax=Cloeon dipterum TaxID=197152 RepID=UPI00321FBBAC
MSKILGKWANFGREIRTAIVFGSKGENVIFVDGKYQVCAFGKNEDGCLGTGDDDELKVPVRIEELCDEEIEGFECGISGDKCSIFAISSSGAVFSWGNNEDGQLGLGTTEYTKIPTKIMGKLAQKMVVQVACGGNHTLVLTSEGQVYAFGQNVDEQLGLGSRTGRANESVPRLVGGFPDGEIVTWIACHAASSFALLHSGGLCGWGSCWNSRSGLGPSMNNQASPVKLTTLDNVVITRIVSGAYFTLALTDKGKVYAWGDNDKGQSGNGTTSWNSFPEVISMAERVKDIAATCYPNHPCAAITDNNQVYIWGNCNGQKVLKPILTSFSSLEEVFAVASPQVSYHRFQLKNKKEVSSKSKNSMYERFRNAFDNTETADFSFIVEGKKIHVHKMLLAISSDVFKRMFLGDFEDSTAKEKIIDHISYNSFYAFLKYLYTDEVDFTSELALEVYAVAHLYQVTSLMEECEKIMKSTISVQNAAAIYDKAILFEAEDLCGFCFNYCMEHLVEVVNSIDLDGCKEEVILGVYRRAAGQQNNVE